MFSIKNGFNGGPETPRHGSRNLPIQQSAQSSQQWPSPRTLQRHVRQIHSSLKGEKQTRLEHEYFQSITDKSEFCILERKGNRHIMETLCTIEELSGVTLMPSTRYPRSVICGFIQNSWILNGFRNVSVLIQRYCLSENLHLWTAVNQLSTALKTKIFRVKNPCSTALSRCWFFSWNSSYSTLLIFDRFRMKFSVNFSFFLKYLNLLQFRGT